MFPSQPRMNYPFSSNLSRFLPSSSQKIGDYGACLNLDLHCTSPNEEDYIRHLVQKMVMDVLFEGVLPHVSNKSLFLRPLVFTEDRTDWMRTRLSIILPVEEVQEKPMIFKFVESLSSIPDNVFKCGNCGGWTYNDRRGNCAACGAPRDELIYKRPLY